MASSVEAQDFPDVQAMSNKVLFAAQDAARERQAAERRRVDDLAQRADLQASLLKAQAASVQQLESDLQLVRSERQLIDLGEAFDAALVAKRWALIRTFLTDMVTIDLDGQSGSNVVPMSADSFVARLPALAGGEIFPRSNQQVRVDGERAILSSNGYAWGRSNGARMPRDARFGQYEFRFERLAGNWKIDALIFRSTPTP